MAILTQDTYEPRSNASTLFLSESASGTWTELDDDLSQYFSNATAGAGTMTMASPASDRLNISHPRTITVRAEINSTDTGLFFGHGTAGNELRFDINSAGTLRAYQNGGSVGTLAIPNLSGTRTTYVCSWASRANPLTTGASDAVQSWLYILDVGGGTVARAEFFHAVKTGGAATATWGTFTGTITGVSHENRCQSLTEIAIAWAVANPVAPNTDCDVEPAPLPLTVASTVGDENQLWGPVPAWAAFHHVHARRRSWSPLANVVYRDRTQVETATFAGSAWYRLAPGSTDYYLGLQWACFAPVPLGVSHAFVRLHVKSEVSSGAAVPIGLRVYSLSRIPDGEGGEELQVFQVGEVVTRDDVAGEGQWDINAHLQLAVGSDGWTILCPALAFDPADASTNDANAAVTIRALVAAPNYKETAGGS